MLNYMDKNENSNIVIRTNQSLGRVGEVNVPEAPVV